MSAQADNSSETSSEKPKILHEIWDGAADAARLLGVEVNKGVNKSGEGYHKMGVVPPGGFMAALVLMKPFGFTAHDILTINVTRNKSPNTRTEFETSNLPESEEVEGLNILLIDDFWRSGKLLTYAKELLIARRARKVDIGVIHAIDSSKQVGAMPDFRGAEAYEEGVSYAWDRQSIRSELITPIRIPTIAEVVAVQTGQALPVSADGS